MARERLRSRVTAALYGHMMDVTEDMDCGVKKEMFDALVGIVERMTIEDVEALTGVIRAIKPIHVTA